MAYSFHDAVLVTTQKRPSMPRGVVLGNVKSINGNCFSRFKKSSIVSVNHGLARRGRFPDDKTRIIEQLCELRNKTFREVVEARRQEELRRQGKEELRLDAEPDKLSALKASGPPTITIDAPTIGDAVGQAMLVKSPDKENAPIDVGIVPRGLGISDCRVQDTNGVVPSSRGHHR